MAERLKLRAQLHVVKNFSVEDHVQRIVFVRHGLNTASDVDDGQTRVDEAHARRPIEPHSVRPAMRKRRGHPQKIVTVDGAARGRKTHNRSDSAHAFLLPHRKAHRWSCLNSSASTALVEQASTAA